MKAVAYTDRFDLCPKCGHKMVYLLSTYQAGIPTNGGTAISKILAEDNDITAVCPNCNYKHPMISSIYGITTNNYYKLTEHDKELAKGKGSAKLIGFIDED